jgi:pimeloyl-ACP methyl ester carboxylesterase
LTVTVLGRELHYYQVGGTGYGPPTVLVHGLGGSANGFYKILFPLAQRFSSVFAVDLPGHGFSPLAEPPVGVQQQGALLAAFAEKVVGQPAFWIGNSLGGALVLGLASQRPELVRALALIAPAGARLAEGQLADLFTALQVRTTDQARALTRRLFHRAPLVALLFAAQLRKLYDTAAVRAVLSSLEGISHLDPQVLSKVNAPILVLWGESEKLLPFDAIDYFRAYLPAHARIEVVKGFGHLPQLERPSEVLEWLNRFADEAQL